MSTEVLNGGEIKAEIAKIAEESSVINLIYFRGQSGYTTVSVAKPPRGNARNRTKPVLGIFSGNSVREIAEAAIKELERILPGASSKTVCLFKSSDDIRYGRKPVYALKPQEFTK